MMFTDIYKTIEAPSEGIYREKASKFLAFAFPVSTEDQVKEELAKLKKLHFSSNHHCYAYILGFDRSAYRINDDGEPSGTAGRPIYGQILSYDLTNVLVVVVRYFGGTKLGVSGLINAYKTVTSEALSNAKIIEKQVHDVYSVRYKYEMMNAIMRMVKEENWNVLSSSYDNDCLLELSIRKSKVENFITKLHRMENVSHEYLRTI